MKKLKLILGVAVISIALSSCGKICVRCENGTLGKTETECFTDSDERDQYVTSREALGYTCNDD